MSPGCVRSCHVLPGHTKADKESNANVLPGHTVVDRESDMTPSGFMPLTCVFSKADKSSDGKESIAKRVHALSACACTTAGKDCNAQQAHCLRFEGKERTLRESVLFCFLFA
eukprot:scaffold70285_cov17-Tisochrysis_lutea.AAC.1